MYSPRMNNGLMRSLGPRTVLILVIVLTGCSSFDREWKQAASGEESGLTGRWQGTWVSEVNAHHGQLRCVVTQTNGPEYLAHFRATYQAVLHFSYNVNLQAEKEGDAFQFQGEADLGWAGGIYHYAGRADGSNFVSSYSSASDHGMFQMKRP
jgi:hypothetical protein